MIQLGWFKLSGRVKNNFIHTNQNHTENFITGKMSRFSKRQEIDVIKLFILYESATIVMREYCKMHQLQGRKKTIILQDSRKCGKKWCRKKEDEKTLMILWMFLEYKPILTSILGCQFALLCTNSICLISSYGRSCVKF